MSSILRALKKLEEERESRSGKGVDVSKGILARRRGTKANKWKIPATMLAVALFAGISTYVATRSLSRPPRQEIPVTSPSPLAPVTDSPVNRPAPTSQIDAPVSTKVETVKSATVRLEKRPEPVVRPSREAQPLKPAPLPPKSPVSAPVIQPSQPEPVKQRELSAVSTPAMHVTGIAWQQEGTSRLAMVNGQLVREGATVGGARVEGILPDRVRFSRDGRTFDVQMDK